MEALGADRWYHFDDSHFDAIRDRLGHVLRLGVVLREDEVLAAGLISSVGGIVQVYLIGWDDAYRALAPSKLWYHGVRAWAKARGDRWFHLGGGLGAQADSLLHFKRGFSPLTRPFRTLRMVARPGDYSRLVAAVDPAHDPADLTGFFPAFRRPAASR